METPKTLIPRVSPSQAAQLLRDEKLIAIPTETVYGLAGLIDSPRALRAIYEAKNRPAFDPLIVHVGRALTSLDALQAAGLVDLSQLDSSLKQRITLLIQKFWPGPLTLLLPRGPRISDVVTSGLERVAIRSPDHTLTQAIFDYAPELALAAPSANRFGHLSPTTANAVDAELSDRQGNSIAGLIDGGPCRLGIESTLLGFDLNQRPVCLRPGAAPISEIESVLGETLQLVTRNGSTSLALEAPGQLPSHYAPRAPLFVWDPNAPKEEHQKLSRAVLTKGIGPLRAMLFANTPLEGEEKRAALERDLGVKVESIALLPNDPGLFEAARQFFDTLRKLDTGNAKALIAEAIPESPHSPGHSSGGLEAGLRDRLRRAAQVLS